MTARSLFAVSSLVFIALGAASETLALANRVFTSARSGNDANTCDDVNVPCKTFAGAVTKVNYGGEVIVLDSGGYGPVTITQALTIEAPAGVTAFIHPSAGDAITVNAGSSDKVTLRGLVLNAGSQDGIRVNSVGTLNVENCFITGFALNGIHMFPGGRLNVKETNITACNAGVFIQSSTGLVRASIDRSHLDGNNYGFVAGTTAPIGGSTTTVTSSTANNNSQTGWLCGAATTGQDVLNLESCAGSENGGAGLGGTSSNVLSAARYSNCVFANNLNYGVNNSGTGAFVTRGNNTITGNDLGPTSGTITSFSPM